MSKRVPDELFREQSPAESDGVGSEPEAVAPEEPGGLGALPRTMVRRGVAPRLVVAGVLGALLLGFGVGRIVALNRTGAEPTPTSTGTATVSATSLPTATSTSLPTLVPFDGPVTTLAVLDAEGRCLEDVTRNEPANLIDTNPNTFWRCEGAGTGEEITFTLNPADSVVGVRVVNGNTVWAERYLAERRILSIQWTFSDGSWVIQGLAASDRSPQEIRFPPVTGVDQVRMTILDVTVPGSNDDESDAVSISSLDFLTGA